MQHVQVKLRQYLSKKLLSFLQNLGKSSTPTQDGPAATTPSKVYVPASTASTGVYESAATPTADEASNIQQLVISASTGVYESAATPTADESNNIQQLAVLGTSPTDLSQKLTYRGERSQRGQNFSFCNISCRFHFFLIFFSCVSLNVHLFTSHIFYTFFPLKIK